MRLFFLLLIALLQGCGTDTYQVHAYFNNIGNLQLNAPVKIAGVAVGKVSAIEFDQARYAAKITLKLEKRYQNIPGDTIASIYSTSLLSGEHYVGLDIGGSNNYLQHGTSIEMTQSAIILEQLIGQFLYQPASPN